MLFFQIKKIIKDNKVIFIATFLALFLFFPLVSYSADNGTLVIKTTPNNMNSSAYLTADPGNPILITGGTGTKNNIPAGTYTLTFDAPPTGYDKPADRQVVITAGSTTTVSATYFQPSNLKGIDRTTAESLLFTPSGSVVSPQYSLVKGEAAITVDGVHWQYSAAELLVKGVVPVIIQVSKSNGTSVIPVSDPTSSVSSEYTITFNAGGGACNFYSAIVQTLYRLFLLTGK